MKAKRFLTIVLSIIFTCLSISVAFAEERGNEHGVLPPASIQSEFETNKEKYTDLRRAQGWVQVGNRWRYQLANGSYVTNQWYQVANRWYHFDSAGYMQTGWFRDTDGKRYYLHDTEGYMMVKWVYTGRKWYYMDEHGVMQTGMVFMHDTSSTFGFRDSGELYYTDLDVPFEFQIGDYWCWAACGSMVGHYMVPGTDIGQAELVENIYGDTGDGPSYGTWGSVLAPAMQELYGIAAYCDDVTILSYTDSIDKLMNYKPFIAQLNWVNTTAYHDITAKGYNDDFQTLFFYNPGAVPNQTEEELEYADFLNGCSFLDNSTGRYHSTLYIE